MAKNLLSLTPGQLGNELHLKRGQDYWVKFLFDGIYHQRCHELQVMAGIRSDIIKRLSEWQVILPEIMRKQEDPNDHTVKWLLRYNDGAQVECVVMKFDRRATVCVSTECGCALGCKFCATGQIGLKRQLECGEIVAQACLAQEYLTANGDELTNVVFMGMGEPLHNYDAVMAAAEIITCDIGMALAPRHLTISTAGLIREIRQFAAAKKGYQLAVSLHSAIQEKRVQLMPVAKGNDLQDLLAVCQEYNRLTKRRVFFEYALLAGVNDSRDDLAALAEFVRQVDGHVNLLSWNRVEGCPYWTVSKEAVLEAQAQLTKLGVRALIRESRGSNIAAACGQLMADEAFRR